MSVFVATSAPENFVGDSNNDLVRYLNTATGGVTVDVLNGGTRGTAEGDTYDSIERFFLTDISDETDYFYGSDADEEVRGFSGPNVLFGGGGDDVLRGGDQGNVFNGGTGLDNMFGGAGSDRFDIAAGDSGGVERYFGGGGTDTIRLIEGGTGSQIDLRLAVIDSVEELEFATDVTLLLTAGQLAQFDVVSGTAGTGEMIQIDGWSTLGGTADMTTAFGLIDSGIDAVSWSYGNDIGTVTLTEQIRDGETGETAYVQTLVADGTNNQIFTTLETFYDVDFDVFRTIELRNSGLQVIKEFDPDTGVELERTLFDLSPDGTGFNYDFRYISYNSAGEMDYRMVQFDDGLQTEEAFDGNGDLTFKVQTDLSVGDTAYSFTSIEEYFSGGVLGYRRTENDATEEVALLEEFFNSSGDLQRTVETFQDEEREIIITGTSASDTFVATDADERFIGRNGTDTFIFAGDVGETYINQFDKDGLDRLDLTAYGIDSREALEDAGALSYTTARNGEFVIDVSMIGGSGSIILRAIDDAAFGNDDFVLI